MLVIPRIHVSDTIKPMRWGLPLQRGKAWAIDPGNNSVRNGLSSSLFKYAHKDLARAL